MAAAAILKNQNQKLPYLGQYSVTMHTVQSWTCELGYGADTMFHRTYFLLLLMKPSLANHLYTLCIRLLCWCHAL